MAQIGCLAITKSCRQAIHKHEEKITKQRHQIFSIASSLQKIIRQHNFLQKFNSFNYLIEKWVSY